MHFIKPGAVPAKIGRYPGNLHDRRVTAEYSALRKSEFTREEVNTYLEWTVESFKAILSILKKHHIPTTKIDAILQDIL